MCERVGDIEWNTPRGGMGKNCLLTLVDRRCEGCTPYAGLTMGIGERRESFRQALVGTAAQTVTPDNGPEFYFPKGTDFRAVTDERVQDVIDLFNHRLRKCPDRFSPLESSLISVALDLTFCQASFVYLSFTKGHQ
jgi:IS30 family transposase